MKTKLIIPEHLQAEVDKRIGNRGKPIEIYEFEEGKKANFVRVNFSELVQKRSIKNLILVDVCQEACYFVAVSERFLGLFKGYLNSGTYPGLTVTIPEHLKHHLPERKGVEFVKFLNRSGETKPIYQPNDYPTVMYLGRKDHELDAFAAWDDNSGALFYLGHLNDGYISEKYEACPTLNRFLSEQ